MDASNKIGKDTASLESLERQLNDIRMRVRNIDDQLLDCHDITPKSCSDEDEMGSNPSITSLYRVGLQIQATLGGIEATIARIKSG